jgi:SnoaL-like protein
VSNENVEVVRGPLQVRQRSTRTLEQRIGIRFPWLVATQAALIGRMPPTSPLRNRMVWRGTRLGMEAFNRRDVAAAVLAGHADFEMNPPREFVEMGFFEPSYRGPEGFREYVSTWSEVLGADLAVQPTEVIDLGERVVLLADLVGRAQASGAPFTGKIATVSTLKRGRATACRRTWTTPRPSKPWGCRSSRSRPAPPRTLRSGRAVDRQPGPPAAQVLAMGREMAVGLAGSHSGGDRRGVDGWRMGRCRRRGRRLGAERVAHAQASRHPLTTLRSRAPTCAGTSGCHWSGGVAVSPAPVPY